MLIGKINRPAGISLLALLTFLLALWNGLRLAESLFFWKVLVEYHLRPGPLYLATSGAFWLLTGSAAAWSLWIGKPRARIATIAGSVGYASWYWFDRLVLQTPRASWPFELAVSAILLILALIILFSPNAINYFR